MTLEELVGAADHEVWFRVEDPDGGVHMFWTADIFGGHGPTLEEFDTLRHYECDDFNLVMGNDPETGDPCPMVSVELMNRLHGRKRRL